MFSFYTIWTRFQISVFIVNRFGDWMLLRFLFLCSLCVQRRSINGFFLFGFSTVKINLVGTESSFKRILCPPILWSNCLQNAGYRYESFCIPECSLDAVSQAIVPENSCLTVGANAMISLSIPLWNFDFDAQKLCNASPWITTLLRKCQTTF